MEDVGKTPDHFEGKTALEHVISARLKGLDASREMHGTEMPGHLSAATDAAKETAFLFVALCILWQGLFPSTHLLSLLSLSLGWLIWKMGRSAILGWARLERLHRLIEEERWEIEHHREQERDELKAMYAAKGLEGKMLDEVTDVLMADDNRLLQVMLEEELGLQLESYEHPLKQAFGAMLGTVLSLLLILASFFFFSIPGAIGSGIFSMAVASFIGAKLEKNRSSVAIIWSVSLAGFATFATYFATKLLP